MDLCAGLDAFFSQQCQTGWNAMSRLIGNRRPSVLCWLSQEHLRTSWCSFSVHVLMPREPRVQYAYIFYAFLHVNYMRIYMRIASDTHANSHAKMHAKTHTKCMQIRMHFAWSLHGICIEFAILCSFDFSDWPIEAEFECTFQSIMTHSEHVFTPEHMILQLLKN